MEEHAQGTARRLLRWTYRSRQSSVQKLIEELFSTTSTAPDSPRQKNSVRFSKSTISSLSTACPWKRTAISSTSTADGEEVEVDMLRVGRVALMYQTKDKSQTGAWNKATGSWETSGFRLPSASRPGHPHRQEVGAAGCYGNAH